MLAFLCYDVIAYTQTYCFGVLTLLIITCRGLSANLRLHDVQDLGDKAKDAYKDAKSAVKDVAGDVKGAAKDAKDSVAGGAKDA